MAVVVFPAGKRRQPRPIAKGQPRGEILMFTGVQIDRRDIAPRSAAETKKRQPGPVRTH